MSGDIGSSALYAEWLDELRPYLLDDASSTTADTADCAEKGVISEFWPYTADCPEAVANFAEEQCREVVLHDGHANEGIVEAKESDGEWWLVLASGEWEAAQCAFYCTYCQKHLTSGNLQVHLDSAAHKRKLKWMPLEIREEVQTRLTCRTPGCTFFAHSRPGFNGYCCHACATGATHGRKCERHSTVPGAPVPVTGKTGFWDLSINESGDPREKYAAPSEPFLAWMPLESELLGPRYLRCLLCSKWVSDEWSHYGSVANPTGSKDHAKRLYNYQWYEDDVEELRRQWHPASCCSDSTATSAAFESGFSASLPTPSQTPRGTFEDMLAISGELRAPPPPPKPPPPPLAAPPVYSGGVSHDPSMFEGVVVAPCYC